MDCKTFIKIRAVLCRAEVGKIENFSTFIILFQVFLHNFVHKLKRKLRVVIKSNLPTIFLLEKSARNMIFRAHKTILFWSADPWCRVLTKIFWSYFFKWLKYETQKKHVLINSNEFLKIWEKSSLVVKKRPQYDLINTLEHKSKICKKGYLALTC